jgi:hypothetical protein
MQKLGAPLLFFLMACGNSSVTTMPDLTGGNGGPVDMKAMTFFDFTATPPDLFGTSVDQTVKPPPDLLLPDYALTPIVYDYALSPYDMSGATDDMLLTPPDDMNSAMCGCTHVCMIQCFGGCCLEDVLAMTCTPDINCLGFPG